jgi:hypothetical protein
MGVWPRRSRRYQWGAMPPKRGTALFPLNQPVGRMPAPPVVGEGSNALANLGKPVGINESLDKGKHFQACLDLRAQIGFGVHARWAVSRRSARSLPRERTPRRPRPPSTMSPAPTATPPAMTGRPTGPGPLRAGEFGVTPGPVARQAHRPYALNIANETVGYECDDTSVLHHAEQKVARHGGLGEAIGSAYDGIAWRAIDRAPKTVRLIRHASKQSYYVSRRDGRRFSFAGLWERRRTAFCRSRS